MPLQPVMKLKVDQLFLHWFHLPDTQNFLQKLSDRAIEESDKRRKIAEETHKKVAGEDAVNDNINPPASASSSIRVETLPYSSMGWGEFGRKTLGPNGLSDAIPSTPPVSPRNIKSAPTEGCGNQSAPVSDQTNLRKSVSSAPSAQSTAVETQLSCEKQEDIQRVTATKLVFTPTESHTVAQATIVASSKVETNTPQQPSANEIDQIEEILTQLHIDTAETSEKTAAKSQVDTEEPSEIVLSDILPETVTVRNHRHSGPKVVVTGGERKPHVMTISCQKTVVDDQSSDESPRDTVQVESERKTPPAVAKFPVSDHFPGVSSSRQEKKPIDNDHIPTFYHKYGAPQAADGIMAILNNVSDVFKKSENERVKDRDMAQLMKAAGLPVYWKRPMFLKCRRDKSSDSITFQDFSTQWQRVLKKHHDEASQFVALLTSGDREYLIPEDFEPLIQDVVETHPGLSFLREAKDFHVRYIHTVIARIWFCSSRPWHERLEMKHLRKSNLLKTIRVLEQEEDINQITQYFSYEHFYVVYCKFWELDKDHDLLIDKTDLSRHNEYALSSRIIKRIFSGAVRCEFLARLCKTNKAERVSKITYPEFVWFLIAEEDKRHPTSIEYWFRCMDLNGDGVLSFDELQYFYSEQVSKLDAMGIETLPFLDCLCQILDMIKPKDPCRIRLADLKRCKMTPYFFDTFFNVDKYLEHEQRDPNASFKTETGEDLSDWERFAAEEYEILVNEDGLNNNNTADDQPTEETEINCDDEEEEEQKPTDGPGAA